MYPMNSDFISRWRKNSSQFDVEQQTLQWIVSNDQLVHDNIQQGFKSCSYSSTQKLKNIWVTY